MLIFYPFKKSWTIIIDRLRTGNTGGYWEIDGGINTQHLYKLQLFYGKMAQYVAVASASFSMNDETIAEKMGK